MPSHRGGAGSPLVCLHGFLDTWRSWELVLPALEREHDVLVSTLAGHAGGPKLAAELGDAARRGPLPHRVAAARRLGVELDGVGHCPQLHVGLETAQLILGFCA